MTFCTHHLTLSERNLRALLHKLDMAGSARTIVKFQGPDTFVLHVERDDEHYEDRAPGRMHPETEKAIRQHEDKWL